MSFSNVLKDLLKEHNIPQLTLANSIGFSQRAVSKWVNAQAEPTETAIIACAKFFNISIDEMVGLSDCVLSPPSNLSATLPSDEKELLDLYRQLSYEGKQRLIARAEVMVEDKERKKYQA